MIAAMAQLDRVRVNADHAEIVDNILGPNDLAVDDRQWTPRTHIRAFQHMLRFELIGRSWPRTRITSTRSFRSAARISPRVITPLPSPRGTRPRK